MNMVVRLVVRDPMTDYVKSQYSPEIVGLRLRFPPNQHSLEVCTASAAQTSSAGGAAASLSPAPDESVGRLPPACV